MSRVRTVVATEILLVLGLLGFVGLAYVVELLRGEGAAVSLSPLAALAFSAVPAALWLTYFYAQDRYEPEPKHYVFGVFLLGAFVAAPTANFIIGELVTSAGTAPGLSKLGADRIIHAFLVVGVTQELCKYLAVRYTIYLSPEFDEPMDGIIYMTAAGIGFATHDNVRYFQELGDVLLPTAAGHAVITTLAHACFAGVLGYALGRAKFSSASPRRRMLILMVGLMVAAALNGQFVVLEAVINSGGLAVQPWRGVAYAAAFAATVFFATSLLMRRLLAASPFAPGAESEE